MPEPRKVYDVWLDEETRWTYGHISHGPKGLTCTFAQGFDLGGESIWYPYSSIQSVVTRLIDDEQVLKAAP